MFCCLLKSVMLCLFGCSSGLIKNKIKTEKSIKQQLGDLLLQLHTEVEKPLLTFRGDNFKKDLKKYDHHIADLRKQLASRFASVEKVQSYRQSLMTSER